MSQIIRFQNIDIPYERLIDDIARRVSYYMTSNQTPPPILSQRQAYRYFGRANVQKWIQSGKLLPISRTKGKISYKTADILKLSDSSLPSNNDR